MNPPNTYRFFTLLLAYLVTTTTLLANKQVGPQKITTKLNLNLEQAKKTTKSGNTSAKQLLPIKKAGQDASKENLVQKLESLVPSSSLSLDPVLNFIFSIDFPSFEYRIYYHEPPIALLPYFENVFAHFIVINAP
ncbi:hypothetical protein BKI52_19435 [marine bacterium AO1-C]|nr:hypothetical protein BKI52_19435 [marine bacterium AO1-C]